MGVLNKYPQISLITVRALITRLPKKGPPEALLLRAKKPGDRFFEIPGGKVDKSDKTLVGALLRELEEEVGLKRIRIISPVAHVLVEPREPGSTEAVLKVLLRGKLGDKSRLPATTRESEDIGFYPLDAGHLAQMRPGVLRWLQDLASLHQLPGQQFEKSGQEFRLPRDAKQVEEIIHRQIRPYLKHFIPLGMRTFQGYGHQHQQVPGG